MVYNESLLKNVTSMQDIIAGVSQASSGGDYLIGNLILLGFGLIFVIVTYRDGEFMNSITIGSFITSIAAILMFYAEMIAQTTIIYPFIVLLITLIFQFVKSRY